MKISVVYATISALYIFHHSLLCMYTLKLLAIILTNTETEIAISELMEICESSQLIDMFNLMSDVLFWIKDKNNRFIYGNTYFLEHLGVDSNRHIIGLTDSDFSPEHIAKQFSADDQKVMNGEIVNNRLELNHEINGEFSWFTTSKRPLINKNGEVIGSYGVSRHLMRTSEELSKMDAIKTPVNYIKTHYMNDICLSELAQISHLSISALERRFRKFLNKTPSQFITEIRLENARKLLIDTNLSIATIANDVGFSDHSYFSRQFNKFFGQLPSALRKSHKLTTT